MVEYKKGRENKVADALSRVQSSVDNPSPDASLYFISFPCPLWLDSLKDSYKSDGGYQDLLFKLVDSNHPPPAGYSLQNGLILYKNKIYLSPTSSLIPLLLQQLHDSPIGSHSGYLKTFHRVKQDFYWQGMKSAIKDHIRCCEVCQRTKSDTSKPTGLLQPLPIPDRPWFDISLDFIEGLPKSHGQDVILVVVDRLTKFVHFFSLHHPFTAAKVAAMQGVFKLHGMPKSIVSDKGAVFTAAFWEELFQLQGTKLAMTSAYHPQFDGQTKVVNRSWNST